MKLRIRSSVVVRFNLFSRSARRLVRSGVMLLTSLILGVTLAGGSIPAAARQAATTAPNCPGAPSPRLITGELARVTPGSPDNVRSKPARNGEQVMQAQPGETLLITGAPICADGFLWWPVYTDTGLEGFVAEGSPTAYYLEPTTRPLTRFTATASADTPINFDLLTLTYPAALATQLSNQVLATTVFSFAGIPNSGATPEPAHTEILFGALSADKLYDYARLVVYRTDAIRKLNSDSAGVLTTLRGLIRTQAAIAPDTSILTFPFVMAGQVFHARTSYLKFRGGAGVRFIPYYAQSVDLIDASRLSYTFAGLTDDDQYYVIASIPLSTAALEASNHNAPDMSSPDLATLYPAYIGQTVSSLEQARSTDFAPDLNALDALIESLTIKAQ